jgi:hypothetical protein
MLLLESCFCNREIHAQIQWSHSNTHLHPHRSMPYGRIALSRINYIILEYPNLGWNINIGCEKAHVQHNTERRSGRPSRLESGTQPACSSTSSWSCGPHFANTNPSTSADRDNGSYGSKSKKCPTMRCMQSCGNGCNATIAGTIRECKD